MANSYLDNCGFAPTAGGTTDWTYSATVAGYQSPANANAANGLTYVVRAQSADLTQWEYSAGAYNSGTNTFPRTTVLYNSAGTGTKQSGAGTKINFTNPPSLVAVVHLAEDISRNYTQEPCGRLTATPGVPDTAADVTAVTTVYYTPNAGRGGNIITLWDGAIWIPIAFAETALSLAGLTANLNYDVWGRINAGVLALDVTAWTNDTTRATAIAQQDGIDVKSGDATRRLLGTIGITGTTGQTEDSVANRFISNRYNDVTRFMSAIDPAATGTQAVGTSWRQANSNTANRLSYVTCVDRPVQAIVAGEMVYVPSGATSVTGASSVGIGIDTVPAATQATLQTPANVSAMNNGFPSFAYYNGRPGIGRHKIIWIEYVQAVTPVGGTATATWIYSNLPVYTSGISGVVRG